MKTLTQLTIKALKGFEAIQEDLSAELNGAVIEVSKIYAAEGNGAFNQYNAASFVIEFRVNDSYSEEYELWVCIDSESDKVILEQNNRWSTNQWRFEVEVRD